MNFTLAPHTELNLLVHAEVEVEWCLLGLVALKVDEDELISPDLSVNGGLAVTTSSECDVGDVNDVNLTVC